MGGGGLAGARFRGLIPAVRVSTQKDEPGARPATRPLSILAGRAAPPPTRSARYVPCQRTDLGLPFHETEGPRRGTEGPLHGIRPKSAERAVRSPVQAVRSVEQAIHSVVGAARSTEWGAYFPEWSTYSRGTDSPFAKPFTHLKDPQEAVQSSTAS